MSKYLVRQYSPSFCTGFDLSVVEVNNKAEIVNVPWADRFRHDGFKEFKIDDYYDGELIVSAYYKNGEHWVVSFTCEVGSKHCKDWRYSLDGYKS